MTTDKAPDLPNRRKGGRPYPSSGVKIGPAWQAMWEVLAEAPGPIWLEHLSRIGAAAGAGSKETMKLLADKFRRAGILASEKELIKSRYQLIYARADRGVLDGPVVTGEWLAEWCEKSANPRLKGIEFP